MCIRDRFQTDPWTRRVARPLLIAGLATSLAIGLLVIVEGLTPGEPWLALVWLCLFAALEGAYTTAWLNNPDSRGVEHGCLLYTSPSPRDRTRSRMPSSA